MIERPADTKPEDRIVESRHCSSCGCEFVLTAGAVAFFDSRDLELPRRCLACRRARRESSAQVADIIRQDRSRLSDRRAWRPSAARQAWR